MEVAHTLLAKLRSFVSRELNEKESEMFATLLAPGVSLAYPATTTPAPGPSGGPGRWRNRSPKLSARAMSGLSAYGASGVRQRRGS